MNIGKHTDPFDKPPPSRSVADAIAEERSRYHDAAHKIGASDPPSRSTPTRGPAKASVGEDVRRLFDGMDRYVPKPPGFLKDEASGGKVLETIRKVSDHPGAEPLWAAWRLGLKDLQAFVLQPFPDSTAPREEPGSIGTPAPSSWTGQQHGVEMDR